MQAMQINLNQSQDIMLEMSRNVQGQNSSIDYENSFDSFLQREMSEDVNQAKEGPPEIQKTESVQESPQSSPEQKSDSSTDNSKSGTDTQASKDDSLNESEGTDNANSKESLKESSEENEGKVSLEKALENSSGANSVEALQSSDNTNKGVEFLASLKETEQAIDDEKNDIDIEAQAALVGQDGTSQIMQENTVSIASGDNAEKIELLESSKKNQQVLKEIPVISVQDERSVTQEGKNDGNFVRSVNYDGNGNATMDLSLNQNFNGGQNPLGMIVNADGSVQQHSVSNAQQFGTMLSSEIQSNSAELVKTGSIILKDGNQGTINLILHPEELGNVKIKLDISDNVLTGKIMVASEEAYNAFKANMSSLKEAFDANGFDTAGFDLSWSGEEQSGDNNEGENSSKNPFGSRYDENIAIAGDGEERLRSIYGHEAYINMIA